MKKYLITGGMGFIGSTLANSLKGDVVVVSRSRKHAGRMKKKVGVILKPINKLTKKDLEGVDVIYHCASIVDNYSILTDPYLDVRINIEGTIHLLELFKDAPKKPKFIFLSTFFVYGHEYDRTGQPVTEGSPTDPLSLYPATKLCAENIIKIYSRMYNFPYLIFRLTNVYGAEESFDNKKKGALNYLIMQSLLGHDLTIYNSGNFVRDYIYVDDVVSALMKAEEKSNEMYLIGYGRSFLFSTLIRTIHRQAKSRSKIVSVPVPQFHQVVGINNMAVDTRKIRALGWKPHITFQEGVKRVIARYRSLLATSHVKI